MSTIRMDSVTSSTRLAGFSPDAVRASRTSSTIASDWSCFADRVTLSESSLHPHEHPMRRAAQRERLPPAEPLHQLRALGARLVEHPAADRDDQAGVLSDRDELRRRDV